MGFDDRQSGQRPHGNRSDHGNRHQGFGHGQKRKREQSPGRFNSRPGPAGAVPTGPNRGQGFNNQQRAKVKAPPVVPPFGFQGVHGLPAKPPQASSPQSAMSRDAKDRGHKNKKKRKTNQLGLTPQGDNVSDTDDEIDEEAAWAENGQGYVCSEVM